MTDDDAELTQLRRAVGAVHARIAAACERAGRSPDDVRLVAVSKNVSAERVSLAIRAGVPDVGENRARELADKAPAVGAALEEAGHAEPVRWHFIGKLQSGTVRHVADHADVVHSAEPGRALEALGRRVAAVGAVLPVLIEVDFTGRRMGVVPEDLAGAADAVARVDGLRLSGVMTIAPFHPDPEAARPHFARLRELRDRLVERHPVAREISMGMSLDYEVAVEEGATMVRVGTALFGPRPTAG